MAVTNTSSKISKASREKQPKRRIHSAPGAMRNPEGVSYGSSNKISKDFIGRIVRDYPQFKFKPGRQEHWSPHSKTITYSSREPLTELRYGLLHELAHALLDHNSYQSDFELLKLESQAWELAVKIGKKYHVELDANHIQDCLDTYRDWLHRRSKCPTCGMHVMQQDSTTYKCFNCQTSWQVSSRRFARSYRRLI